MSLKDKIENLIKLEQQKLEVHDQEQAEYGERQCQRFQPMRKLLEEIDNSRKEIVNSAKNAYIFVNIEKAAATIEIGEREFFGSFSKDLRWKIEPNSEKRANTKKGQETFDEIPGFRVEETEYSKYAGDAPSKNIHAFASEQETVQYLLTRIAQKIAHYRHLGARRGWKGVPQPLWELLVISIPVITFGISTSLLSWVSGGGHHFVGIAVSVVPLVVAIGFMSSTIEHLRIAEVEDPLPYASFWVATSFSVAAILILLCVFAEMSFVLLSWKVAVFLPGGGPASYPDMLRTYAWFFMDMIPFTEPAKTFGMTGPQLQPDGWMAGGPVFAFQAAVVVYLLEVLRRGWLLYQRHSTQQFYQRLGIKAESNDPTSKSGGSEK